MNYKGYFAVLEYDKDHKSFVGRAVNTSDEIIFYGKSVDELQCNFAASVEAHLALCTRQGIEPSEPW
jgi:predicted HicB family RNase H-like nuclease